MKGSHGPTNQLQDLNWGAFDHASHAPQLRSCDYYLSSAPCSVKVIIFNQIQGLPQLHNNIMVFVPMQTATVNI